MIIIKGYCYIALIIGFFIFYQQNPMYALIVIGVFIVGYIFVKSRRSGSGYAGSRFLSGKAPPHNSNIDDLITLMILQQLNNNTNSEIKKLEEQAETENDKYIEKIKQETLALLDE